MCKKVVSPIEAINRWGCCGVFGDGCVRGGLVCVCVGGVRCVWGVCKLILRHRVN